MTLNINKVYNNYQLSTTPVLLSHLIPTRN